MAHAAGVPTAEGQTHGSMLETGMAGAPRGYAGEWPREGGTRRSHSTSHASLVLARAVLRVAMLGNG